MFCYSDVPAMPTKRPHRLRPWPITGARRHDLTDVSNCASWCVSDQIDILVDLTGHIGGGKRMLVFRPQAGPGPSHVHRLSEHDRHGGDGLSADRRLFRSAGPDRRATTPNKLVRLPTDFLLLPAVAPMRPPVEFAAGAASGHVTFGSFNNFAKVTPQVLDSLGRDSAARAAIAADLSWRHDRLAAARLQRNVCRATASAPSGLSSSNRLPRPEYLELIGRVDIALDPFPFNGHTTTCDCLWQGVPVVTLSGETYASRFGGSGLVTLGLEELIAHSLEQYVEIAARPGGRLGPACAHCAARCASEWPRSPLLDLRAFTRNLEAEYRRMWTAWCTS